MIDVQRLATDAAYWDSVAETYGADVVQGFIGDRPRPQSQPEWDGGLPPAGTVCEVSNCGQPYEWCKVRFMGETLCVVDHAKHVEQYYHLRSVTFRPICIKDEQQRDELADMISYRGILSDGEALELADAILAAGWQKPD